MSAFDWNNRVVLVTGGTRGIGLETTLCFARAGARCVITYRWGGSEDEAMARFRAEGLAAPRVVQADVAQPEHTEALLRDLRADCDRIDAFVSNVAIAGRVRDLADYKLRALTRSIEYTSWPIVSYTQRIGEVFGSFPHYIVGVSSLGTSSVGMNYDFVAASKAVLETFVRYLAYRLRPEGVRVNAVTCGLCDTASSVGMGDAEFAAFTAWHLRAIGPIPFVPPVRVAEAIFGLCSGYLDGLSGQILTVDDGSMTFAENRYGLFRASLQHNQGETP